MLANRGKIRKKFGYTMVAIKIIEKRGHRHTGADKAWRSTLDSRIDTYYVHLQYYNVLSEQQQRPVVPGF